MQSTTTPARICRAVPPPSPAAGRGAATRRGAARRRGRAAGVEPARSPAALFRRLSALAAAAALVTTLGPATPAHAAPRLGECAQGSVCLWQYPGFNGDRYSYELLDTGTGECTAFPESAGAAALANRVGRPVTAYQSAVCDDTGDFQTYPSGSWAPEAPYAVRAFKVWER